MIERPVFHGDDDDVIECCILRITWTGSLRAAEHRRAGQRARVDDKVAARHRMRHAVIVYEFPFVTTSLSNKERMWSDFTPGFRANAAEGRRPINLQRICEG